MDRHGALREANRALTIGNVDEALRLFWWLAEQTHIPEHEYNDTMKGLSEVYSRQNRIRAAAFISIYLRDYKAALSQFSTEHPEDLARVEESRGNYEKAGHYYLEAQRNATAAICFERAGIMDRARLIWENLRANPRLHNFAYQAALAAFNHGRCCEFLDDHMAARHSMIEAVHLLEQAADEFESAGTREQAFDCFQVLLAMGARKQGAFENLAEGYLNCIRILKADNLRYYVLHYYEDFQRQAIERDEFHAAATLLREASDYCKRVGLPYDRYYQRCSAKTWIQTADAVISKGQPVELAENALLAAIDLLSSLDDFHQVGKCYKKLAELELGKDRVERYERIYERYKNVPSTKETQNAFPDYLRQEAAYPDVWYLDLIEWEQEGDHREVSADLIASHDYPESIRRRALLCRLEFLMAEERDSIDEESLVKVALRLGYLTTYTTLSPLEKLYSEGSKKVRAAAMSAIKSLFFKRSFRLLNIGLQDESKMVRKEALEAIRALHFTHALDPLARLYREHPDPNVRIVALQSVGKISTPDAAEFLLEVVRYGGGKEASMAKELLTQLSHPEIGPLLARHAMTEKSEARTRIIEILRRRGDHLPF